MGTESPSLFCDIALAERVERAEAALMATASRGFGIPVGGGVATFGEPGSPFNKVAGLVGVPSAAELAEVERAFAERGAAVQVELAHVADPAIGALLTERGYRLVGFENVLGRVLTGTTERVKPQGVEIRTDDEVQPWIDVQVAGFAHPDTEGTPSHEEFPRDVIDRAMRDMVAAGTRRYTARFDGVIAGGASFRVTDGIAQLTGAATAPEFRRRGVQTALLSARLADAAEAGCDLAVITTQPGSKSHQNAQRRGFDLLYTRAILIKTP
ncbi:bifunctional aminotransferase class I/II-fold pyridoxal phosphate-dependent enzyme/GNAT family N-acetyltransferase [Actinokineospora sp. NBRC 105648]|uniref:GNAT family N-acetyltransferase n=1 Tax=Actinokineospora sp. NBRC 105648 TaxID=3032206 RepID=UPI0024A57AD0|nr:bifunctional aminotransferase class I/II-fold pyridoxal phosphate-dependent enzyme/GNAT family N-acetyltransferase [Actinokineospora sp. NBRC 105648]GLZ39761.1 GNAT family acetyltransferase [Actinokineospora sp. NBRC 105648]